MSMNINNCTDALDLVFFLSDSSKSFLESADCDDCCDDEYDDVEYTEEDESEVDDDVYDAAMEDLYGDGISIGDLDAEEMSCSVGQLVDDEIEDTIYDDIIDEGCSLGVCDYDGNEEDDDVDDDEDYDEDDDEDDDNEEEDVDDDEEVECALENDMFDYGFGLF